jgi:purine nucleoside permease
MTTRGVLLAAGALALLACGPSQEVLFKEKIARQALTCFHPRGEFDSAGEVVSGDGGSFTGTIYWHGRALGKASFTKVRVKTADRTATVTIVEDNAVMPALSESCQVPLGSS